MKELRAQLLLKEKCLKDEINKVRQSRQVEVVDLASNVSVTTVTPSKNTGTPQKEKTKSSVQFPAESSLESQRVALLTKNSTKCVLGL